MFLWNSILEVGVERRIASDYANNEEPKVFASDRQRKMGFFKWQHTKNNTNHLDVNSVCSNQKYCERRGGRGWTCVFSVMLLGEDLWNAACSSLWQGPRWEKRLPGVPSAFEFLGRHCPWKLLHKILQMLHNCSQDVYTHPSRLAETGRYHRWQVSLEVFR